MSGSQRPKNWKPCRNCTQATGHWSKLCIWCRRMGLKTGTVGTILGAALVEILRQLLK